MMTPWGPSQSIKEVAPGIVWVDTAGHGGFKVDDDLNGQIPGYMRSPDGFYEEDVEWARVVVSFPGSFSAKDLAEARRTIMSWEPKIFERRFGIDIPKGQSYKKDEAIFLERHADDLIVRSAWGDWAEGVPKGMVGVYATTGGRGLGPGVEEGYFLVPADEYEARSGFGFIVDPSRHERVEHVGL